VDEEARDEDRDEDVNELPENLRELLNERGIIRPSDNPQVEEFVEPLINGRCQTCHKPLGESTCLVVTKEGILMGFCGGACFTDIHIMHWLEEQYGDMLQAVKFRGGDEADG
jgi:hypothetical protein